MQRHVGDGGAVDISLVYEVKLAPLSLAGSIPSYTHSSATHSDSLTTSQRSEGIFGRYN